MTHDETIRTIRDYIELAGSHEGICDNEGNEDSGPCYQHLEMGYKRRLAASAAIDQLAAENNPATRTAAAREIALQAIESSFAEIEKRVRKECTDKAIRAYRQTYISEREHDRKYTEKCLSIAILGKEI